MKAVLRHRAVKFRCTTLRQLASRTTEAFGREALSIEPPVSFRGGAQNAVLY